MAAHRRISGNLVLQTLRRDDGNLLANTLVGLEVQGHARIVPERMRSVQCKQCIPGSGKSAGKKSVWAQAHFSMMTRAAFFTVFVRTPLQSKSHAGISLRGPWLVVALYHGASKASATVARTQATSLPSRVLTRCTGMFDSFPCPSHGSSISARRTWLLDAAARSH